MRMLILASIMTMAAAAQPAVNVSGKWTIPSAGRGGGGGGRGGQTLMLNQAGSDLSGELIGGGGGGGGSAAPINNEIYDGKVDGANVSFYVWRGTDKPAKTFYKGAVNAAGDEITFAVTGGVARGGAPAGTPAGPPPPVVARRAK
jgi:hypothetical protein